MNIVRPPLVLFVEDRRSYRQVFRRLMKNSVRLIEADNGLDGLQLLVLQDLKDPIRLVVADNRMPGLSGEDFLDIVGNRWPEMPRLLLSGFTTGEMIMNSDYRVLDKGVRDWLIRDTIIKLATGS